ncbi:hypothetical protein ATCC90586_005634 [Pythium insidiosum]|nr:hypothetical protein ATCC90586_005634 [Pythium insidiosum]
MTKLNTDEDKHVYKRIQIRIKRIIGQSLPAERLHEVGYLATGMEMWSALCEVYEKKNQAGARAMVKPRLLKEVSTLKYKEGGGVSLYLAKMFMLKKELTDYDHDVQDIDMINLMLGSHAYSQLRHVVRATTTVTPEAVSALICEEILREEARGQSRHDRQDRQDKRNAKKKGKGPNSEQACDGRKKNPIKNGKVFIDEVLYKPTAEHGLLSPGLAQ